MMAAAAVMVSAGGAAAQERTYLEVAVYTVAGPAAFQAVRAQAAADMAGPRVLRVMAASVGT
jgi:hypothetical protein